MNDYSWNLETDYIAHGRAHYSDNWTQEQQNEYNKWYYQHNKDKWKNSKEQAQVDQATRNIEDATNNMNRSTYEYNRAKDISNQAWDNFKSGKNAHNLRTALHTTRQTVGAGFNNAKAIANKNAAIEDRNKKQRQLNNAIEKDKNDNHNQFLFVHDQNVKKLKDSGEKALNKFLNAFPKSPKEWVDDTFQAPKDDRKREPKFDSPIVATSVAGSHKKSTPKKTTTKKAPSKSPSDQWLHGLANAYEYGKDTPRATSTHSRKSSDNHRIKAKPKKKKSNATYDWIDDYMAERERRRK